MAGSQHADVIVIGTGAGAGGVMAGATFADGLACAVACDALLSAAETGRRISVPPPR